VPKVHFINEQVTVEVAENTTLRQAAMEQGIEIYRGMWMHFNCFGNGICGRCKVWITSSPDTVSRRSKRERFHRIRGQQRLACQVRIVKDVEVRTRPMGPAVVREVTPDFSAEVPSYREMAAVRLEEARQEEARKAKAEAAKKAKAKAEAEAKAKAEAEPNADTGAKPNAETGAKPPTEAKPSDKPAPSSKQESA
jgi:ferredoxin